tara:strand:- start:1674 stop:2606 length:933 start_codon:yes stop_codon:yes gene_type:complete
MFWFILRRYFFLCQEGKTLSQLFCFGLGFSGRAFGQSLVKDGWKVSGTTRDPQNLIVLEDEGFKAYFFPGEECLIEEEISSVTHLIITIPPQYSGDIVYRKYHETIERNRNLKWIGYLSSTGVYGNRDGDWVDEESELIPSNQRNRLRIEAENNWVQLGKKSGIGVHIFRAAGIYGEGRSIIETIRARRARRIEKKGHISNRIHLEDLVSVLKASIKKAGPSSLYNVCDDSSSSSKEAIEFACKLLKTDPPPLLQFEQAELSEIARSFYLDNKRIRNDKMKKELNIQLKYPDYQAGLVAIFKSIKSNYSV